MVERGRGILRSYSAVLAHRAIYNRCVSVECFHDNSKIPEVILDQEMWKRNSHPITIWVFAVQFFTIATAWSIPPHPRCKALPKSPDWPNEAAWTALNSSLCGRLIKSVPPGAVCHPEQATYNAITCPAVQAGFLTSIWHSNDPVSSIVNNWNNDTCLPYPTVPCSGEGYPVYVVNASSKEDVKAGVDFARQWNVRLIVKGTGHDYLGR